jgi:hypothetical protein
MLRRSTEWRRVTVQKAKAQIVVDQEEDAPARSHRRVRVILLRGLVAFRLLESDVDANVEIAATRTFEWPEVEGPESTLHFRIGPTQRLWAIVGEDSLQGGVVKLSVVIEYHGDEDGAA